MNKTTRQYTTPIYKRWEVIARYGWDRYGAEVQRSTVGRHLRLRVRAYRNYGQWEDWPDDLGEGLMFAYQPERIGVDLRRQIRKAFCFVDGYLHCKWNDSGLSLAPRDLL